MIATYRAPRPGLAPVVPFLLLFVLVFAACGEGGGSGSAATAAFCGPALEAVEAYQAQLDRGVGTRGPPPWYGGSVVVGGLGDFSDGMNAFVSADHVANQHQIFGHLMTLIRFDETLTPVPWLAESWDVSEDRTTLTFTLRDDVRWHDGEPTDAEDVVFTFERASDPETGFPNAAFWDHYTGVEMIDSLTVRFTMEPHADFIDPWRTMPIMPEHLLGDVPPSELKRHPFGSQCPVGNGPFVFVSHRPQESWTFAANHDFPEELGGRPFVDRYVYRVVPEPTTLLTDLLTENLDVYVAPPADQAAQIRAAEDLVLGAFEFREFDFVAWNSRRPQLADPRVRRALTVGTNRAEIVDALLAGYGQVANSPVPPFHWAHDPSLDQVDGYDPDEAARLLDEAGWVDRDGDGVRESPDGVRLSIEIKFNEGNQQRQDVAEIMQAQLAQVGVEIRPVVVEWTTLVETITETRDFDGVILGWVTEFKVDDTDLFASHRSEGPYAFSGTRNPEIDRLLDTLQKIPDRTAALPLWHEYQRVLNAEQPYTFLYYRDRLVGVNKRLRGVRMDPRGEWVSLHEWWIDPLDR
ncbi:MAG: ABC transporter substrate-binding protein [Longimicrobiales bacterium]|nr:ABC transporter substrate-binding protein [Longimicrobiales bacterium]